MSNLIEVAYDPWAERLHRVRHLCELFDDDGWWWQCVGCGEQGDAPTRDAAESSASAHTRRTEGRTMSADEPTQRTKQTSWTWTDPGTGDTRTSVAYEITPGVYHVSAEMLEMLMRQAGWTKDDDR